MNDKNNMLALSQERFSARKFTPEALIHQIGREPVSTPVTL